MSVFWMKFEHLLGWVLISPLSAIVPADEKYQLSDFPQWINKWFVTNVIKLTSEIAFSGITY